MAHTYYVHAHCNVCFVSDIANFELCVKYPACVVLVKSIRRYEPTAILLLALSHAICAERE